MRRLRHLLRAYEKRLYRERLLILFTACVLLLVVGLLATGPLTERADREANRVKRLRGDIAQTEQRMVAIQQELHAGPLVRLREQQAGLQREVDGLNEALDAAADRLISPRQMVEVLERVLVRGHGLDLLALENERVVPLFSEEQDPQLAAGNLYRHGFVLRLKGGFFPVLDYLSALEAEAWPFFWESLRYEVEQYPDAIVELQLHTLSDKAEWVGV